MPTLPAPGPGKAMCEDSAFQVTAELPLHIFRHRPLIIVTVAALGEPGLEVLLDAAIEHAFARTARPIPRRCAVGGPALGPHARPLCAALRRWGSGWAARYACRHWPQRLGRAAEGSWLNSRRRLRIARRRSPRQWRLTGRFRGGCERRELADCRRRAPADWGPRKRTPQGPSGDDSEKSDCRRQIDFALLELSQRYGLNP